MQDVREIWHSSAFSACVRARARTCVFARDYCKSSVNAIIRHKWILDRFTGHHKLSLNIGRERRPIGQP